MKKNLRKLLSLLLCLMLCMSLFPAGAALAEEPEAEQLEQAREENEATTEMSPPPSDEFIDYYVTSFAELKELAGQEYDEHMSFCYLGSETFVFEEDLTLTENMQFISYADVRIPSDVVVTTSGELNCWGDTGYLYVEGTLVAYNCVDVKNINVSGSLQSYYTIYIPYEGEMIGEENISFFGCAGFSIFCDADSLYAIQEIIQNADIYNPDRYYVITLEAEETISIAEEFTLDGNIALFAECPLIITGKGSLNINARAELHISKDLVINGTLHNDGWIAAFCPMDGKLELNETGIYSGTGKIHFYGMVSTFPEDLLPGFDLTAFDVTGSAEEGWTLTLKTEEETVPGDVNGDGKVNTMDLIRLMKSINGEEVEMVEGAGDVNGDGKVNTMDLIRLMKYINGENVELK